MDGECIHKDNIGLCCLYKKDCENCLDYATSIKEIKENDQRKRNE